MVQQTTAQNKEWRTVSIKRVEKNKDWRTGYNKEWRTGHNKEWRTTQNRTESRKKRRTVMKRLNSLMLLIEWSTVLYIGN